MSLPSVLRRLFTRASLVLVAAAVLDRVRHAVARRGHDARAARRLRRDVLTSLYDVHPAARVAPRRRLGLRSVALDDIVGTLRHPSQNTADFLPLPGLRGKNWHARWQRIQRALDGLHVLPPVDLVQVGDEYWVEDGHNRVAAAKLAGAVEIDADVTQLLLAGVTRPGQGTVDASTVADGDVVRRAGTGHYSRTVEQRPTSDSLSRGDLLRDSDEAP